jgi:hypothetical protein
MSATLINSTVILNEILALLRTKCVSLQAVNRDYDKRFATSGSPKPGTTIYARKPIQVGIRSGKKMDVQDTVEENVPISCTTQFGVDLPAFTSEQLTMNINDFSERYLKPASSRIAAELDRLILQHAALNFWQYVGTPGTTPASATVLLQASQKLDESNADDSERYAIVNPAANTALVNAFSGLYNPQGTVSNQWKTGVINSQLGLKIGVSNNIHRVTCGTRDGTMAIDDSAGLVEGMSSVNMDGFGATETWKQGEKFTIAGVYAVNPETKVNTGQLQCFVVTEDFTAVGGEGSVSFSPALRSTGPRQNVNALPADDAVVTAVGTLSTAYPYNIVMQKDAIVLATADLPMPKGVHDAARKVLDGVSMRMITDYNAIDDEFVTRFDVFYGISTLRGELGVVLLG